MIKKVIVLFCFVLFIGAFLCGCTNKTSDDRFVGFYIIETSSLGEKSIEDFTDSTGRIYATKTNINGEDNYEFEEIEGVSFYLICNSEEYTDAYLNSDPEITDMKINGSNENVKTSAILYAPEFIKYSIELVYETTDGDIYMIDYTGCNTSGETTTSYTEKNKVLQNGKEITIKETYEIKVKQINKPQKVVLKQMNESDEVIDSVTVTKENIPETLTKNPETAYIIAEKHSADSNEITREILETDEESYECIFTGDKGFCVNYSITIQ